MKKQKLELGDTFTTAGGLELEVIEVDGAEFVCLHRPTNWRGIYRHDGEFLRGAHDPDKNLHADFYEADSAKA